jgi:hypothetical protein
MTAFLMRMQTGLIPGCGLMSYALLVKPLDMPGFQ